MEDNNFMLLICFCLFICIYFLIQNYNNPLGLDEPAETFDDVLDNTPTMTNFLESAQKAKFEEDTNSDDYRMKTGYLDVIIINRGGDTQNNNKYTRFKQDEDYYNPDVGAKDRMNPMEEVEIIRKQRLSNGIVMFDRKRTVNVETGKYANYFQELRKN